MGKHGERMIDLGLIKYFLNQFILHQDWMDVNGFVFPQIERTTDVRYAGEQPQLCVQCTCSLSSSTAGSNAALLI